MTDKQINKWLRRRFSPCGWLLIGYYVLMNLLCLRQNQISFYAVESLLFLGQEVPAWAVEELAHDLVRANLIYSTLENFGQTDLFPLELRNEVYLAKSDLVHWLTYPTELGQTPDEIEYIGRIKYLFKKDVYHVFQRYVHIQKKSN